MTTNNYFQNPDNPYAGEQKLIDDLTIELIQIKGHNFKYLPRTMDNEDTLLGDSIVTSFNEADEIEMYIESVDGFGGEGDMLSQFGFELRDTANLIVSITRWEEVMGENTRPDEGDLIYFPLTNGLFEISFVDAENVFYQQSKLYAYRISIQQFSYSHEDFNTGDLDIDQIDIDLENDDSVVNDPLHDNDVIETEADSIQDFDETNPFGRF